MNTLLLLTTIVSLLVAAAMSVAAWRLTREARRRSEARISILAAAIADADAQYIQPVETSADLFSLDRDTERRSVVPTVIGAGALIFGVLILTALLVPPSAGSGSSTHQPAVSGPPLQGAPTPARRSTQQPIELVSLEHERRADRLTVHGIVRNPTGGNDLPHLTAVVLLFDSEGALLTTERGIVETTDLAPGVEAPFTVSVSGASDVGRYRVSFRADDDHLVPHVDKRNGA